MKRLLCIVGKMDAGGAETFLMKIYRNLDKTQYQMDFAVSAVGEGAYDKEIETLGGRIYNITPKKRGGFKNFLEVKSLVNKNKYNFVLRTSQHSLSALELFAANLGGAKVRVFRSSNSNTTSSAKMISIIHEMMKWMPNCFANVRVAPSTEAAEFMFGKNCIKNKKAFLLNNAVDFDKYEFNSFKRDEIRLEFDIQDAFVIGHIGRFSKQKNHDFLIDVFNEVSLIQENARLLLIGTGDLETEIRNKVESLNLTGKVIFAGTRADISDILSATDVLAFPSFYEGMPNTVIEAQANGLQCIVSDRVTREANITNLVEYLPIDNAEAWCKAIVKSMGKRRIDTRKMFNEQKYDIATVTELFIKRVFDNTTDDMEVYG